MEKPLRWHKFHFEILLSLLISFDITFARYAKGKILHKDAISSHLQFSLNPNYKTKVSKGRVVYSIASNTYTTIKISFCELTSYGLTSFDVKS